MQAYIELDGVEVLDATHLLSQCDALGIPANRWRHLANSLFLPRGEFAGVGYFIIDSRNERYLNRITEWRAGEQIPIRFFFGESKGVEEPDSFTVSGFYLHRISTVLQEGSTPHGVLLVEVADMRTALGQFSPVDETYNLRIPSDADALAADAAAYHARTLNGSNPYTWQEILSALWPTFTPAPSFVKADFPVSAPENIEAYGDAWFHFCRLLRLSHHELVMKTDGTFHVQALDAVGFNDTVLGEIDDLFPDYLQDRGYAIQGDIFHVPETIRVFFPRHNYAFQTSAFVDENNDRDFKRTQQAYTVDVAVTDLCPACDFLDGTVAAITATIPAVYSDAGAITNAAALSTHAQELAERYLASKRFGGDFEYILLGGFHNINVNAGIASVAWYFHQGKPLTEIIVAPVGNLTRAPYYLLPRDSEGARPEGNPLPIIEHPADVQRFAVVVPRVDVLPGASQIADIQYGIFDDVSAIAWSNSASHFVYLHNISVETLLAGRRYIAWYDYQARNWVAVHQAGDESSLALVQIKQSGTNALLPGGSATAFLVNWNGAAWVTSATEVTIYDPACRNCALPTERVWCVLHKDSGRYEVLGENGTIRFAKAAESTTGGECIDVMLACSVTRACAEGCGYDIPDIADVDIVTTQAFLACCADEDDPLLIKWFPEVRQWQDITQRAATAKATLAADLCPPDGSVAINNFSIMDCQTFGGDVVPNAASNTYYKGGCTGDTVFLVRKGNSGSAGQCNAFEIVAVSHEAYWAFVEIDTAFSHADLTVSFSVTNGVGDGTTPNVAEAFNNFGLEGEAGDIGLIAAVCGVGQCRDWVLVQVSHKAICGLFAYLKDTEGCFTGARRSIVAMSNSGLGDVESLIPYTQCGSGTLTCDLTVDPDDPCYGSESLLALAMDPLLLPSIVDPELGTSSPGTAPFTALFPSEP